MALDPSIATPDGAGHDAGDQGDQGAGTQDGGSSAVATTETSAPQTFTQDQVNAFIAREKRGWNLNSTRERNASLAALREEYEQRYAQPKPEPDAAEAYLQQVIDARMRDALAPIQAKEAERDLDAAIRSLSGKYKDWNEQSVLQSFLDLGLDRATHIPVQTALEMAYKHSYQPPDIEAIKRAERDAAIKEYTNIKIKTASKTPKPEGTGGQGTVGKRDLTNKRDFEEALDRALARIE